MTTYHVELETTDFDDAGLQEFLKNESVTVRLSANLHFPIYEYRSKSRLTLVKMILEFWRSGDDVTDDELIASIKPILIDHDKLEVVTDNATQDEINQELDGALEEAAFNGDITVDSDYETIQAVLTCMVQVTPEQWKLYAVHCLQKSMESSFKKKNAEDEPVN